jgi:hypothetical protein
MEAAEKSQESHNEASPLTTFQPSSTPSPINPRWAARIPGLQLQQVGVRSMSRDKIFGLCGRTSYFLGEDRLAHNVSFLANEPIMRGAHES